MNTAITIHYDCYILDCCDLLGGRDFSPINQTLTFGPELPTQQCLEIVTYLDSVLEFRESIQVIATIDGGNIPNSPTTGLIINSDSMFNVIIVE